MRRFRKSRYKNIAIRFWPCKKLPANTTTEKIYHQLDGQLFFQIFSKKI
jgi:hypothetical protein